MIPAPLHDRTSPKPSSRVIWWETHVLQPQKPHRLRHLSNVIAPFTLHISSHPITTTPRTPSTKAQIERHPGPVRCWIMPRYRDAE
jgi:hypothetical protein